MGKEDAAEKSPGSSPAQARAVVGISHGKWYAGLLLSLLLGLALGYGGSRYVLDNGQQQYDNLKKQFDITSAQHLYDLNAAMMRADAFQGQLAVEESTRRSLEATLQATQQDLGRARDQLAFFNQLLPPGPNGSISIRALDIERRGSILSYKALLMRNAPGETTFNGLMEFVANGTEKGKAVKITLEPAKAADMHVTDMHATTRVATQADAGLAGSKAETQKLELSFDQFQRSEGVLSIPVGFVPKTITLNILDGKTVRVSRTVSLPSAP